MMDPLNKQLKIKEKLNPRDYQNLKLPLNDKTTFSLEMNSITFD